MEREPVQYRKDGRLAYVSLHRPERHNALTPQVIRKLAQAWRELDLDREVRAAVMFGEGPSFCSGMDLKQTTPGFGYRPGGLGMVDNDELEAARVFEALPGERRRINYVPPPTLSKPVIAALHGRVAGGGMELALCSDIRIAAEGTSFALPEVTRGIVPGSGGMVWLPRIIGAGRAMEWLLTGDVIDSDEALRIGLVNKVVPKEQLLDAATAMANRISENAPLAVQAIKETVLRALGTTLAEGLAISEQQARALIRTADYEEGVLAFKEKRAPVFHGQ